MSWSLWPRTQASLPAGKNGNEAKEWSTCTCTTFHLYIHIPPTPHTQGEYDIVTTDYERAKSLFAGTQVKVFKKGTILEILSSAVPI